MQLIYCDETNLEEKKGIFFVYGGVSVSDTNMLALSKAIDEIRDKYGVPANFRLKFNPGPKDLHHQDFINLKQSIIEEAIRHDCRLFASLILHDVATSPNNARRNEINRICYHFWCYLNRIKDSGMVLIDHFKDKQIDHHLREKFSIGLTDMPYSKEMRLDRIVGFHYSAIGQSHMCSVVDIVLGSLRFAVNAHNSENEKEKETAKKLLSLISPLFFREDGRDSISEIGLFFSPKIIRAHRYREQYCSLHAFMSDAGLDLEQAITNERNY
ncbi:DUF3800 domain-containing protein [Marinobacter nitratireducens]|uniref:DUF3800 domain-containing protein n=1 Tax=Marinobacter nitratireducens TaxID=1137280 RepID=UPI00055EA6D1|nr:DUF3800 domain-containing protein [Marinobacter nitratireducens]